MSWLIPTICIVIMVLAALALALTVGYIDVVMGWIGSLRWRYSPYWRGWRAGWESRQRAHEHWKRMQSKGYLAGDTARPSRGRDDH